MEESKGSKEIDEKWAKDRIGRLLQLPDPFPWSMGKGQETI